ncbi:MAG: hypothetical protein COA49_03510 [Bacteroidetes bacterium]|nr:MAG: hypothetical protein COA49_03510 [Bacteroidota bacterium]
MMVRSKIWGIAVLLFAIVTTTGCSNERRIAEGKPLRSRDASNILKHVEKEALDWEWMGFKMDTDFEIDGESESFTLSVKMSRDSAIWISLSPALGVEMARILLSPDSVRVISKVPSNKFVFEGDYDDLGQTTGLPFDFYAFQSLFAGTPLGLDKQDDKFISKVDGRNYFIIEKFPRTVKKLLGGVDERHIALNPDCEINVSVRDRKAERMINRTDERELIIKRYWFDGLSFMPVMDVFDDLESGLTLKIVRSGDEGHRQGLLPTTTHLSAFGNGVNIECTLHIRRSRINRKYDLPFDPPKDYERRKSL